MPFFRNYPNVPYKFGNESFTVDAPDLVRYSEILDTVKNNGAFYQKVRIKYGMRPDNLSFDLYKNANYHWTFFYLNDDLRERGWPLEEFQLTQKIADAFSNTVVITQDEMFSEFLEGSIVTGGTSEETGTILRKNVDLGQLYIEGSHEFINGELLTVTENGVDYTVTVKSSSTEKDAVIYYTDGTDIVDVDPFSDVGGGVTAVTYEQYYREKNEELRDIIVLKPEVMTRFISEFKDAMR